jgi:hypothetical protein
MVENTVSGNMSEHLIRAMAPNMISLRLRVGENKSLAMNSNTARVQSRDTCLKICPNSGNISEKAYGSQQN